MADLSDKQRRFCEEYTVDFNATQAAIRAGYSPKTANEQASRLLANVSIQAFVRELQQKLSEKTEITKDKIVAEYAKLAFFDIRKILTVDGGLKPTSDWDDETAAAIAGLESIDMKAEDMVIGNIRKVKVSDKRAALDSLCKVLGFNAPVKSELSNPDGTLKPETKIVQTMTDPQVEKLISALRSKAKK